MEGDSGVCPQRALFNESHLKYRNQTFEWYLCSMTSKSGYPFDLQEGRKKKSKAAFYSHCLCCVAFRFILWKWLRGVANPIAYGKHLGNMKCLEKKKNFRSFATVFPRSSESASFNASHPGGGVTLASRYDLHIFDVRPQTCTSDRRVPSQRKSHRNCEDSETTHSDEEMEPSYLTEHDTQVRLRRRV